MSDAENYYGMALWYAWGRMDSGEYRGKDLQLEAFEFATLVRERRERFVSDSKVTHFKAIQEQWTAYVEEKEAAKEMSETESEPIYSLSDCVNYETNVMGDCGGRVWKIGNVIVCENCRNKPK